MPHAHGDFQPFLAAAHNEAVVELLVPTRIGRARFNTPWLEPEPIYELRVKPDRKANLANFSPLRVRLQRVTSENASEELQLVGVEKMFPQHGSEIQLQDFELRLQTLAGDEFWMDDPRFDVQFTNRAVG
jgi:hypothetical protein